MRTAVDNIDMQLSEIAGLVKAILFMEEEADEAKRAELQDSIIAMLYVIGDKLKSANGSVSAVVRAEAAEALH